MNPDLLTTPVDAGYDPGAYILPAFNIANPADNPSLTGGGVTNPLTGFLGKAADTLLDVYAFKEKNSVPPGVVYPTGQSNPAAVKAQTTATAASTVTNWKPIAIYAGIGIAALLAITMILKRR